MTEETQRILYAFLDKEREKRLRWKEPSLAEEIHQHLLQALLLASQGREDGSRVPLELGDLFLATNKVARMLQIGDPNDPDWLDSVVDAMIYILRAASKVMRFGSQENSGGDR